MRLLKRGAEGDLFETVWNCHPAVLKVRRPKTYRNAVLDLRIRRQRTMREAQIMMEAKSAGVMTPLIYLVDPHRCAITMQLVRGKTASELGAARFVAVSVQLGRIAGALHKGGIMHGDLTTSNYIVSAGKIFVIDFGLAVRTSKPEDHAVDLRLFKEILNSAHTSRMRESWDGFLSGYEDAVGAIRTKRILGLVEVIEGRGRYARVV